MKRVMSDGLLRFPCTKCDEVLEVRCGVVVDAFGEETQQYNKTHGPGDIEFIAEAPHIHAEFWGHMVRCHQPHPHPYMSTESS